MGRNIQKRAKTRTKLAKTLRNGLKRSETGRNGQRQAETDRNGQKPDINGQKLAETTPTKPSQRKDGKTSSKQRKI